MCQLLEKAQPEPPELGHDMPVTNLSRPMLVNDSEQIDRIARTAADLPVTFDGGARSGRQLAQSLARFSPELGVAVPHFLPPPFLVRQRLTQAFLRRSDVSEDREIFCWRSSTRAF